MLSDPSWAASLALQGSDQAVGASLPIGCPAPEVDLEARNQICCRWARVGRSRAWREETGGPYLAEPVVMLLGGWQKGEGAG